MHSLFKPAGLLLIVAVSWVLTISTASAQSVSTYDEMYSRLPGAGKVNHSASVDRALRILEKNQLMRERRIVTIKSPRDLHIINHRFISITFNATLKKQGHARQKAVPGLFALLFEKNKNDQLSFYKSTYLAWIGARDLEEYKKMSLAAICSYYREKGAEYVIPDKPAVIKDKKLKAVSLNGSDIKSGIVKDAFIDSAITRDSELKAVLEGYQKKEITTGATGSDLKISQLEARIKRLEALLANVSRKGNDIYFQKVNLHILNGTGSSDKVNGTGNLIVGYGSKGKGSHNIAVGNRNTYSSFGSIVTGSDNAVTKKYSAVTGGRGNIASGSYSTITGGHDNRAGGDYSSILGGSDNKAKGKYSSINGQRGRTKVDAGKNKHFKK